MSSASALLVALVLAASACALPGQLRPNFGLPYSAPTTWPYCVTELADHWVSYPAQKDQPIDRVCGPKESDVARGLELLGAYSFDKISDARGGRVRIVLSAQTLTPEVGAAGTRGGVDAFAARRLADVIRNPARTTTYAPWQESHALAVAPLRQGVEVRGRRWDHVVVAQASDPGNVWVEDYITALDASVVLVLRARYALDDPPVPAKLEKRRALTRAILDGIDIVALK